MVCPERYSGNNIIATNTTPEQSHNSLSALIKGFTLAFRSIIERLSRGHATPMDYQTLLSLSEIASKEALVNWEDVSDGFSYRQASLRSTKQAKKSRGSNSKRSLRSKSSRSTGSHHSREPSSQDQRASNIERPHHKRRASTISSEAHSSTSPPSRKRHKSKGSKSSTAFTSNKRTLSTSPRNSLRKSGTSFTSVSTKLGEIPASKLTRNESYAVAYPMKPYVKPGKDSRLKRWFRG